MKQAPPGPSPITAAVPADSGHDAHNHPADGGQSPAGITVEDNPTYQVGTEVILTADHMPGMQGAEATIDYSTKETVYMVDLTTDEMTMTNHK